MGVLFYALVFIIVAIASVYSFIFFSYYINKKWLDSPSSEGKFADSKGRKVFYRIKGKGGAVVIILGAIGSSQAEWWAIQNEISQKCRLITYDRPGFDWSIAEDNIKTFDSISDEINLILKFERIRKPVYLAAHWTGALYARHYAKINPEKVLGILLVNPIPFNYREWKDALSNLDECPDLAETARKRKRLASKGVYRLKSPFKGYKLDKRYKRYIIEHYSRTSNYDVMIDELEQFEAALSETCASDDFPEIPVRVLYSSSESLIRDWVKNGINEYSARQLQRAYENLLKDMMNISPYTTSAEIAGSGEFIHLSKPDVIVQEINRMISSKKGKKQKAGKS